MLPGAFTYLDQQIEAVRTHIWPAFTDYDATAIHQARVATRRLKAGMEVLTPLLADLNAGGLATAGKLLRRRLGPMRDLDVIIANVAAGAFPPKLAEAAEWVRRHFEADRADVRDENTVGPKKLGKMAAKFDEWWRIRHDLERHADAVLPLLTNALHARFDAFATLADRVAGVVESPADAPPIDIHELRIDGKAVRYAFEIAAAQGMPIPKKVAKTFKAMQDALGDWHDEVVLAERVLLAVVNANLPLHQPTLAAAVLDVARAYLQRSEKSLAKFKVQWKRSGPASGRRWSNACR
ncbi:MAG: CHAD domain-containing protein [Tepidisphaeraceae bacterium]